MFVKELPVPINNQHRGWTVISSSTFQSLAITFRTTRFNPLKTKRRLLYLKTQSIPRCKHFSSRL